MIKIRKLFHNDRTKIIVCQSRSRRQNALPADFCFGLNYGQVYSQCDTNNQQNQILQKIQLFLQRSINPPTQFPLSEVFFSSAKGNFGTYKNTFGPHCKRWALIHISLPFKTISVEQQYKAILDTVCCFLIIYEQYRGVKKCMLLVNMI